MAAVLRHTSAAQRIDGHMSVPVRLLTRATVVAVQSIEENTDRRGEAVVIGPCPSVSRLPLGVAEIPGLENAEAHASEVAMPDTMVQRELVELVQDGLLGVERLPLLAIKDDCGGAAARVEAELHLLGILAAFAIGPGHALHSSGCGSSRFRVGRGKGLEDTLSLPSLACQS